MDYFANIMYICVFPCEFSHGLFIKLTCICLGRIRTESRKWQAWYYQPAMEISCSTAVNFLVKRCVYIESADRLIPVFHCKTPRSKEPTTDTNRPLWPCASSPECAQIRGVHQCRRCAILCETGVNRVINWIICWKWDQGWGLVPCWRLVIFWFSEMNLSSTTSSSSLAWFMTIIILIIIAAVVLLYTLYITIKWTQKKTYTKLITIPTITTTLFWYSYEDSSNKSAYLPLG